MHISCKQTTNLIAESQARDLSENENVELQNHLKTCIECNNEFKQDKLLSSFFKESSDIDETYIIPLEIMQSRVETQILTKENRTWQSSVLKKPMILAFAATILCVIGISSFNKTDNSIPYEYTVALAGINVEIVEDDEILCDMLYTIGLPNASIDVIGCDTTCNLVIFDLKSQQEAEKVVKKLHSLNKNLIRTKINKIEQYNIS